MRGYDVADDEKYGGVLYVQSYQGYALMKRPARELSYEEGHDSAAGEFVEGREDLLLKGVAGPLGAKLFTLFSNVFAMGKVKGKSVLDVGGNAGLYSFAAWLFGGAKSITIYEPDVRFHPVHRKVQKFIESISHPKAGLGNAVKVNLTIYQEHDENGNHIRPRKSAAELL